MGNDLSNPQESILSFIERYIREQGRPPTNREIGQAVQIASTGHIDHHLTMLERKGYIVRVPRKSRGIRLTRTQQPGLRVAGTIAAGAPLDIFPGDLSETLDLGMHTREHTREYVLLVRGQSMIEDHIADGDFVLIDPDSYVNDGDIIVATRKVATGEGGAATLKRIYRERDRVKLQPANAEMEPIFITAAEWDAEWEVQGKVTAVYRRC